MLLYKKLLLMTFGTTLVFREFIDFCLILPDTGTKFLGEIKLLCLISMPFAFRCLSLILLTWTIWRAPTNASKWRVGFNSAFKGLNWSETKTKSLKFLDCMTPHHTVNSISYCVFTFSILDHRKKPTHTDLLL